MVPLLQGLAFERCGCETDVFKRYEFIRIMLQELIING
jgi:hypothetical protein